VAREIVFPFSPHPRSASPWDSGSPGFGAPLTANASPGRALCAPGLADLQWAWLCWQCDTSAGIDAGSRLTICRARSLGSKRVESNASARQANLCVADRYAYAFCQADIPDANATPSQLQLRAVTSVHGAGAQRESTPSPATS